MRAQGCRAELRRGHGRRGDGGRRGRHAPNPVRVPQRRDRGGPQGDGTTRRPVALRTAAIASLRYANWVRRVPSAPSSVSPAAMPSSKLRTASLCTHRTRLSRTSVWVSLGRSPAYCFHTDASSPLISTGSPGALGVSASGIPDLSLSPPSVEGVALGGRRGTIRTQRAPTSVPRPHFTGSPWPLSDSPPAERHAFDRGGR